MMPKLLLISLDVRIPFSPMEINEYPSAPRLIPAAELGQATSGELHRLLNPALALDTSFKPQMFVDPSNIARSKLGNLMKVIDA